LESEQKKSQYRPDIDGLRAVAVLSVLLFHADVPLFGGGYVGVDIFFVISGFLITSILVREIQDGSFSVVGFYERRFRRLLPALFVVVVFTLLAGVVLLHPRDLLDLGQSAVATAVFSSNILFNLESGYFDGPAEFKPLLHTWSLGVEEQFYIVLPLLLLGLIKYFKHDFRAWIAGLFVCSLVACVVFTGMNATASFYLFPFRAWELLAGSLLAVGQLTWRIGRIGREILGLCGTLLIGVSIYYFSEDTVFPGYSATLPVLGTVLLIYSGGEKQEASFINKVLSTRLLVFFGLISYSLYLWHWPLLVYANYVSIEEISGLVVLALILLMIVLATATWKFIEQPFRKKNLLGSSRKMLAGAFAASVMILISGLGLFLSGGIPERYNYADAQYYANKKIWDHWGVCQRVFTPKIPTDSGLCNLGESSSNPSFILWGDSHARSLAPSVDMSAQRSGVTGSIATRGACPPLLGIDRPGRTSCAAFNDKVYKHIIESEEIDTVILAARWTLAATGNRYKEEFGSTVQLVDINEGKASDSSNNTLLKVFRVEREC
jgi:peptidoglycan/LPS O-acetylase OafA/YrhL